MALETGTYIADLVAANPTLSDPKSQGDDHLRLIKTALRNCFAGFAGAVIATGADSGAANTYVLTPAQALPAYTLGMVVEFVAANANTGASTLNISGLGATAIKTVDGAALGLNDILSGQAVMVVYDGTAFRLLAVTKRYVDQLAFAATLPLQSGNAGKILVTDGTNASWTNALTIALNEAKGADIPSAATINLTAATGNFVHVTGTTTITAITIPVGAERTVVFDGVLTLTHGAALLLPGAANIVTAAGDRMVVRGDTAGANVVSYTQANGRALVVTPYGLSAPLAVLTPTAAANVDALNVFSATYDNYLIICEGIKPTANDTLLFRFANAGAVDSGSNYIQLSQEQPSGTSTTSTSGFAGSGSNQVPAASIGLNAAFNVLNANSSTTIKSVSGKVQQASVTQGYVADGIGSIYIAANAISGIRFFWSGGSNFVATGTIRIYGYNNT